jgi:hypothetical protein
VEFEVNKILFVPIFVVLEVSRDEREVSPVCVVGVDGTRTLDVLGRGKLSSPEPRRIGPIGARLAREPMLTVIPLCFKQITGKQYK